MKNYLILSFSICLLIFVGCKTKSNCELSHTGDLFIMNKGSIPAEIYVNGENKGNVAAGKNITITQSVGTYVVKIKNNLNIKEYSNIVVRQCEQTDLNVSFYE